jgi:hypothetical protein
MSPRIFYLILVQHAKAAVVCIFIVTHGQEGDPVDESTTLNVGGFPLDGILGTLNELYYTQGQSTMSCRNSKPIYSAANS